MPCAVGAEIEISIPARVRAGSYPIHFREISLAGYTNYKLDFVKISQYVRPAARL